MGLPWMSRSNLFLLSIALAIFGTAVIAGHPDWGTFTGLVILLLAGGMAAGALPLGSESDFVEQRAPRKKISTSLATLSSAAILAVYVAGYHRTDSAADGFADQSARRSKPASIVATAVAPQPTIPGQNPPPPPLSSPPPRPKKTPPPPPPPPPPTRPPPPRQTKNPPPPPPPPAIPPPGRQTNPARRGGGPQYKDGTYLGWGTSRHGDIQASVVIQGGQIVSAEIAQCLTRYSCSWIASCPDRWSAGRARTSITCRAPPRAPTPSPMPSPTPCPKPVSDTGCLRTAALMGTFVTIQVVGDNGMDADPQRAIHREEAVERAFEWFRRVEECCTRFDAQSELMQLTAQIGVAVPVSAILLRSGPVCVGGRGGERRRLRSNGRPPHGDARLQPGVSHRADRPTPRSNRAAPSAIATSAWIPIGRRSRCCRPLILDLGAVAKGLAIDMAARELQPFENFAIDAGGDLYLGGCSPER